MMVQILIASLICFTYFLLLPGALLVVGAWPVVQIVAAIGCVVLCVIWLKFRRRNIDSPITSLLTKRTLPLATLVGFIVIGLATFRQSLVVMEHNKPDDGGVILNMIADDLTTLETGVEPFGDGHWSNSPDLGAIDDRIKVLKDKFDFKTRYDEFKGNMDYELKSKLPRIIRDRDDWVMRPWFRLGIWIHIACNVLLVLATLYWTVQSRRSLPEQIKSSFESKVML